MFAEAVKIGGANKVKQKKTLHGVKDTFQDVFLDRITAYSARLRGSRADKQAALDLFIAAQIPDDIRSPVFCIKGTLSFNS